MLSDEKYVGQATRQWYKGVPSRRSPAFSFCNPFPAALLSLKPPKSGSCTIPYNAYHRVVGQSAAVLRWK